MKAEYIQHVGSDLTVVNAARVSFDKESEWEEVEVEVPVDCHPMTVAVQRLAKRDEKLIGYLSKHGHWTPFSHCFVTLRETVPIFVARQRFKHMVGFSYNEVSRRYVDSEPEFYIPNRWRLRAENLKQGSTNVAIDIEAKFRDKAAQKKNARRSPCSVKFHNWKARAVREGKEFNLTLDDIPWVLRCPILDIELDWSLGHGNGIQKNSPTLDRIDNTKGYEPGNIMVISSLANTMKSCATPDELIKFAEAMLVQYKGQFSRPTSDVAEFYEECKRLYKELIDAGMCPEQVRMFMPQSMYTSYYVSGSLAAWARMYKQRIDPHAQEEIRDLAQMVGEVIEPLFPVSWKALTE